LISWISAVGIQIYVRDRSWAAAKAALAAHWRLTGYQKHYVVVHQAQNFFRSPAFEALSQVAKVL